MIPAEPGVPGLANMREAVRGEGLDGWLFCNFHHRDALADDILGIAPGQNNSRLWVFALPAGPEAAPLRIVHAIEPGVLDHLPGEKVSYISREDFLAALRPLGGRRWGVHVSDTLTAVSWLDAGTAATLESAGLKLCSAAGLVQRFRGLLDPAGIESHERAGRHLYEIVEKTWERVQGAYRRREALREGDLRALIIEEMKRRNLVAAPPIVAAGPNSANPHYDFSGPGALIREGDLIQLDLWTKETGPGAVYADISWVGVFAPAAPPRLERVFTDLLAARDGACRFIGEELRAGRRLPGAAVDRMVREFLGGLGYGAALKHRTGHGIDTECHGSGVNMDSVEFPDSRPVLEGSCFSLEPGLYFSGEGALEKIGLRTEIDVYIRGGQPVVSGGKPQSALLLCRP